MKDLSFVELLEKDAPVSKLTEVIIHELSAFNRGKTVDFNFLSRLSVGGYCRSLGFATNRNWSMLVLNKIAPKSPLGPNIVPEREAQAVLAQLCYAIDKRLLEPKMGRPQLDIISDFLPKGNRYKRAKPLGHPWEFQYALAVELEHGKTRGSNLTNNHPSVSYTHLRAHETGRNLVCRLLLEKK